MSPCPQRGGDSACPPQLQCGGDCGHVSSWLWCVAVPCHAVPCCAPAVAAEAAEAQSCPLPHSQSAEPSWPRSSGTPQGHAAGLGLWWCPLPTEGTGLRQQAGALPSVADGIEGITVRRGLSAPLVPWGGCGSPSCAWLGCGHTDAVCRAVGTRTTCLQVPAVPGWTVCTGAMFWLHLSGLCVWVPCVWLWLVAHSGQDSVCSLCSSWQSLARGHLPLPPPKGLCCWSCHQHSHSPASRLPLAPSCPGQGGGIPAPCAGAAGNQHLPGPAIVTGHRCECHPTSVWTCRPQPAPPG